jgi:hypothetical protein
MTKNSIDGIVLTFNLKIVETDTKTIPLTNMFMTVYFQWLGTNASIKSGRGKLVFFGLNLLMMCIKMFLRD